jgi:hypothetical protein
VPAGTPDSTGAAITSLEPQQLPLVRLNTRLVARPTKPQGLNKPDMHEGPDWHPAWDTITVAIKASAARRTRALKRERGFPRVAPSALEQSRINMVYLS